MQTLLYFLFISCHSANPIENERLNIVIKYGQSYKIDLPNKVYEVYYLSKPPSIVKFNLTDYENNLITGKYYSLRINRLSKITDLKNNCNDMPKVFTEVEVKSIRKDQVIKIEETCEKYDLLNRSKANRVREFVQFIRDIIESKTELNQKPVSDIPYI